MTSNNPTMKYEDKIDQAIVIGFLYGIQSDSLEAEEVQHRVAGFRHTKGYKEAKALLEQVRVEELDNVIKAKGNRTKYARSRLRELGVTAEPIIDKVLVYKDERKHAIMEYFSTRNKGNFFYYRDIAEWIGYDMDTGGSAAGNYIAKCLDELEKDGLIDVAGNLGGKKSGHLTKKGKEYLDFENVTNHKEEN